MTDSALSSTGAFRIGNEEHKNVFCALMLKDFEPSKPTQPGWQPLADDKLKKFAALPFWNLLLQTKGYATCRLQAMADRMTDVLLTEAISTAAFEQGRDKIILRGMLDYYRIEVAQEKPYRTDAPAEWLFMRAGYAACVDSFLAAGLFKLAEKATIATRELLEAVEPVLQNEIRQSVFFVNWLVYSEVNKGLVEGAIFRLQGIAALLLTLYDRRDLLKDKKMLLKLLPASIEAQETRLGALNPKLVRPKIMRFLASWALKIVR